MNFDFQPIVSWFKKYRNFVIAGILAAILIIGGILAFTDWLGNWIDMRRILGWQTNVNALGNVANQANANIQILNAQNGAMEQNVNELGQNHNAAINATNDARHDTNQSLTNLNGIQRHDFNGIQFDQANAIRCQAFPDRPECRK